MPTDPTLQQEVAAARRLLLAFRNPPDNCTYKQVAAKIHYNDHSTVQKFLTGKPLSEGTLRAIVARCRKHILARYQETLDQVTSERAELWERKFRDEFSAPPPTQKHHAAPKPIVRRVMPRSARGHVWIQVPKSFVERASKARRKSS